MSEHLQSLFLSSQNFFRANPAKAMATFSVTSSGDGALHRQVKIREFVVDIDEPQNLGGTNTGPNPVEIALASLATCQEISYHLHAAALGIPLKEVSVTLEGTLDLRGFSPPPMRLAQASRIFGGRSNSIARRAGKTCWR